MKGKFTGGTTLANEATRAALRGRIAQAIEDNQTNVPQFAKKIHIAAGEGEDWKTTAIEQSIRSILKGKNVSLPAALRWSRVLDSMNGTVTPIIEDETEILKALLAEAEKERDIEKDKRLRLEETTAKINRDRHVLEERVKDLQNTPFDKIAFLVEVLKLDEFGERLLRSVLRKETQ